MIWVANIWENKRSEMKERECLSKRKREREKEREEEREREREREREVKGVTSFKAGVTIDENFFLDQSIKKEGVNELSQKLNNNHSTSIPFIWRTVKSYSLNGRPLKLSNFRHKQFYAPKPVNIIPKRTVK